MSQKTEVDGLLLVKKPVGCTSHDVVAIARRKLNTKSVGHTGTLDPLASGLMVLVLGQATRLSQYLMEGQKTYRVGALLGVRTDMLDIMGQVLSKEEVRSEHISKAMEVGPELVGALHLPVPQYSAVKVRGKKLYEYARENASVPEVRRDMFFHGVKSLDSAGSTVRFEISCEKGGYIRSWVQELGERVGIGATVESLERIEVQPFFLQDAIDLESEFTGELKEPFFVPMDKLLSQWPSLQIEGRWERLLLNGQIPAQVQPQIQRLLIENGHRFPKSFGVRLISSESGRLLSLILRDPIKTMKLGCVFPRNQ